MWSFFLGSWSLVTGGVYVDVVYIAFLIIGI